MAFATEHKQTSSKDHKVGETSSISLSESVIYQKEIDKNIAIVKAPVTIQMTRQFPRREVATIREKARVQTRSRELQPSEDPGSPEDRLMLLVLGP